MKLLRQLGLTLCATLFSLAVFGFAIAIGIYTVFRTPTKLESALQQSGVYSAAATSVINQSAQQSGTQLPLTDPGVQSAIKAALPASTVQQNAEQVINSFYDWIQGRTQTPNFNVNITGIKSNVSDNVGSYLRQKLSALPTCPAGTMLPQNTSDIFNLTCIPRGVSIDQLVAQGTAATDNSGVLKDNSLTAGNLKTADGQTLTQKLNNIPRAYRDFVEALFALPVLAVLTGLGVVFWSATRRAGLRRLSATLVTTGIYSTLIALVAAWGLDRAASALASQQSGGLTALESGLVKVGDILCGELRHWWLIFGISYIVFGVIGLIIVHATRPKGPALAHALADEQQGGEEGQHPLGHNRDIPQAGTKFNAEAGGEPAEDTNNTAANSTPSDSPTKKEP
ncbi:MAG TPA: hypothetical protein VLG11_06190 [Candidatus Saccharimonadales bacterium]|nr:hypothetical protein [Candidatus Saccharimonadales bacterium]